MMKRYAEEEGKPINVISDHGTQFNNRKWEILINKMGMKKGFTLIRHPQSNMVERYILLWKLHVRSAQRMGEIVEDCGRLIKQ